VPQAASLLPPECNVLTSKLIHEANFSNLSSYARHMHDQSYRSGGRHAQERFAEGR
jgi:hypothetical protein